MRYPLDGYNEWIQGPRATNTATQVEFGVVKWLPPMALVDLYHQLVPLVHELQLDVDGPRSYVTFTRVYRESYSQCLQIRANITHIKCDVCEKLNEFRKQSATLEAAAAMRAEHMAHVKESVDYRTNHAGLQAVTTPGGVTDERSIVNADIDAMEVQKFKCP